MITVASLSGIRKHVHVARNHAMRIALVPTMGYLHEGHLSLVRAARDVSDFVVVSLFVNPTQFGPHEDLERYPRDPERDARLCESEEVDVLFMPRVEAIYAPDHSVFVEETHLSRTLCGVSRPGHFRGVATIVVKLFNMVIPDVAVFGQKDAQQARIIEQVVRDLNIPVEIVLAPIVRESDGLAMSSRNRYLSPEQRALAPRIHAALETARVAFAAGVKDAALLKEGVRDALDAVAEFNVEYVEVVAWHTLRPVPVVDERVVLAVAVRVGNTRLIDNVFLPG